VYYGAVFEAKKEIPVEYGCIHCDSIRSVRILPLSPVASYAILVGGILTIAATIYMVVSSYSRLPFLDGWVQIKTAADGVNPLSPAWLWQQHNEHRLLIPKLFLAADLHFFHATQAFLLASILVIQLLHLGLLTWSMYVLGQWRGSLLRSGIGLTAFCLFSPSQWQNFVWGFQVCFVLPQLFATLSFVALIYGRNSPKWLAISIGAALGATYSLVSGNLLWPLLVIAAACLRLQLRSILAIAISGTVSTALYFHRYVQPAQHASPLASLHSPVPLMSYWIVYVLSSWAHAGMHGAETILIVLALLAIASFIGTLQNATAFRPFAWMLLFLMAFYQATSLITAAGRINFGVEQALESRYQTVALLFWCCLGLLVLGSAYYARDTMPRSFLAAQVLVIGILIRGAILYPYPLAATRYHEMQQRAQAESLAGGADKITTCPSCPDVGGARGLASYMRNHHLSIFADPVASTPRKP
jgi:hypothetical protein